MRRVWNIGSAVMIVLLALVVAGTMLCAGLGNLVLDRTEGDLGYRVLSVEAENADGYLTEGDLAFAKVVSTQILEQGTVVVCRSVNPETFGKIQVCTVDSVSEGTVNLITDGAGTVSAVPAAFVLGTFQTAIPGGGAFLQEMKTAKGFCLWILLPMLLLFLLVTLRSVDQYRRNRAKIEPNIKTGDQ